MLEQANLSHPNQATSVCLNLLITQELHVPLIKQNLNNVLALADTRGITGLILSTSNRVNESLLGTLYHCNT
jgi:hypothetical protein